MQRYVFLVPGLCVTTFRTLRGPGPLSSRRQDTGLQNWLQLLRSRACWGPGGLLTIHSRDSHFTGKHRFLHPSPPPEFVTQIRNHMQSCRSFFPEIIKLLQLIISWSWCNKTYVSMLDFIKMPLLSARGCGKCTVSMCFGVFLSPPRRAPAGLVHQYY